MLLDFTCSSCGKVGRRHSGHVNRSNRIGAPLYCDRWCAGKAHRTDTRSPEQKRADKRAYDAAYRERRGEELSAKRKAYYAKVGPTIREKEREHRHRNMALHVEYCRQPEYREKKHEYDVKRVSGKYAEYAEAHRILVELEREIRRRMPDKYERLKARGYYERQNERAKEKRNGRRLNTA